MNVIITGATGMVGEGVLHEALMSPEVTKVLVIGRRSCEVRHEKLAEIITPDLGDLSQFEPQLAGFDACFFCLGVSSIGMDPETYRKITYDLTMSFARTLARLSPGLSFFYISGGGTDSTERGRLAWARVKGKTENDLRTLGFRASYGVRPGFLTPTPGLKRALSFYKYITWLLPLLRAVAPSSGSTLAELGQAMIRVARTGYPKPVLEVPDIVAAAKGEVAG